MLTVQEIAKSLKVHKQTVYRWIYADKLKALKVGRSVRITKEEFDRFVGGKG